MRRLILSSLFWLAILLTFACGALVRSSSLDTETQSLSAPYTVRQVEHSFDADWPDIYLILAAKCAGCHRPGNSIPNLSSYDTTVAAKTEDGEPLVVPGRPEDSW